MLNGVRCKSVQVPIFQQLCLLRQAKEWKQHTKLSSLCYPATSYQLSIYFINGSIYIPVLLSQFVPPSLSPTVPTSLFSRYVSLFLSNKQLHLYHLWFICTIDSIYALIYDICFSFSDLLHSIWQTLDIVHIPFNTPFCSVQFGVFFCAGTII